MGFFSSLFDEFIAMRHPTKFPWTRLVMPLLTLIGAWGGFPDSPKMFKSITKWRPFQYFFLWILVMQGGGVADPGLSLLAVLIFIAISEIIKYIEDRDSKREKFENQYSEEEYEENEY